MGKWQQIHNYQQRNLKKQEQGQTKQTSRTRTELQKWRSHGGYQWGGVGERMGGKVQGIRSVNGRYKIDRERLRIV